MALTITGGRIAKLPSYNEILPRLYLGDISMAMNREGISSIGITDMISVEIKPLSPADLAPTIKRYLYINVMDHSKQDILSHFATSNEFIENALKTPSNKVYVHCVAGISRSASLVIAYIMKTRSMNYMEAFSLVKEKRKIVDPNEGFVRQLSLYHRMKYTIDIGNEDYRTIVLDALAFEFKLVSLSYQSNTTKTSIFPLSLASLTGGGSTSGNNTSMNNPLMTGGGPISNQSAKSMIHMPPIGHKNIATKTNVGIYFDQYYNKLNLQQVSKFPNVYDPSTAYRCNKCRVIVFYAISVIENKAYANLIGDNSGAGGQSISSGKHGLSEHKQSSKECQFIFIEPQPWMSKNILERSGNLECYKCKRKLGKFDWTSGESCSCPRHSSHMNFNLFKIMRKKVDRGGPAAQQA